MSLPLLDKINICDVTAQLALLAVVTFTVKIYLKFKPFLDLQKKTKHWSQANLVWLRSKPNGGYSICNCTAILNNKIIHVLEINLLSRYYRELFQGNERLRNILDRHKFLCFNRQS